jgi:hypothetical protein
MNLFVWVQNFKQFVLEIYKQKIVKSICEEREMNCRHPKRFKTKQIIKKEQAKIRRVDKKDNAITRTIVSSMKPIIPFDKMFESMPGFSYCLANIPY